MAEVNLSINGSNYGIACDDGQEDRVGDLGRYVDDRLRDISRAGAAASESHLLVLTALVLADEIYDMRDHLNHVLAGAKSASTDTAPDTQEEELIVRAIDSLAGRIDSIAGRIQNS
jgi:cell division protein ZapA